MRDITFQRELLQPYTPSMRFKLSEVTFHLVQQALLVLEQALTCRHCGTSGPAIVMDMDIVQPSKITPYHSSHRQQGQFQESWDAIIVCSVCACAQHTAERENGPVEKVTVEDKIP